MNTINLKDTMVFNNEKIEPNKIVNQKEIQIVHLCLMPGQKLKLHTTPVDVLFHVLLGAVDVIIGDERRIVTAGTIVESPKNIPHALENNSAENVSVLVIKTPNPQMMGSGKV